MDLKKIISARKARLGALTGTGVLLLAVGLTLANLLSQRFFLRSDWTVGGRYSLSRASRRLVRDLPDPVLLRAYISNGFPPEYAAQARYVADLLGEYRAAARGKVRVEIRDPESSEKVKEDARRAGVTPIRITQVASDQFQMREGYLGLAIFYQDKQEVMPFIQNTGGLEYEISSRLRKMSRTTKKTLGIVTGHGETPMESLRGGAGARLFDSFDVRPVTLSTSAAPSVDLLLVLNPTAAFTPVDLSALDAAVSSGTPTAVFLSRKTVSLQNFGAFPRPTGLEEFLAHYGARVGEDFVFDAQCQQVSVQSRQGGFTISNIVNYPPFVLCRPDRNHPLTRSLDALAFPFAHPIVRSGGAGIRFTPLAASSPYSWVPSNVTSMDPFAVRPPQKNEMKGPFTLAALVEGSTTSFTVPSRRAGFRMAVVGTGYFADDGLPIVPGNADFLSGLAEWMVQEKDFVSIPTHGQAFRPLRQVPAPVRGVVKVLGFFFPPLAMVLWGFARWRRRRVLRPVIQKEWESFRG
jgi:gliding-associated putative ABC transporter substrate-binding component GldG